MADEIVNVLFFLAAGLLEESLMSFEKKKIKVLINY